MGGKSRYVEVVKQEKCRGMEHLRARLDEVQALGGEGLMLRQPGSKYVAGRSNTLLKVKSFEDDEAIVLGYEDGKGKYEGMVGSLKCALRGTILSVVLHCC